MLKQSQHDRAHAAPARRPAPRRRGGLPVAAVAALCVVALALAFVAQALPAGAKAQGGEGLRISEVMSANGSTRVTGDGGLPDWIEVENTSDRTVDLTGFTLMRGTRPARAFVFPGGALGPGEFAVILADGGTIAERDGVYHAPFRLPASGDTLTLLDRSGAAVDDVDVPALAKDQVYCRDVAGEWQLSAFPTPGEVNRVGDAAAAQEEQRDVVAVPGALEISEAMSNNATFFPDETGAYPDYIEIHNTTDAPVNLQGWFLSDTRSKLRRWTFPAVTLPADGYLAVHCSGVDRRGDPAHLHASFKLSSGGEEIFLTDPKGVTVSAVRLPTLEADQAWSLLETGWTRSFPPTPNQPNTHAGADAAAEEIRAQNGCGVYITEILASSAKSDDWIELYNESAAAVDLSGFGLSDNAGRPRKWQFPSGTVIQPGAYLGVVANGADTVSNGRLCTNYRLSADGGYSLTLSDTAGRVFDRLYVPTQYRDLSYGRTADARALRFFTKPTPGSANSGDTYLGRAPLPVYSHKGGLYSTGDNLSVELKVPGNCQVYYTLDYTDPDQGATLYTEPIPVSSTTVLRTRVYGEGYLPSYMDSQSYLYDVNNGDGTVFVMSLVSDPYNLTSDEAGIMVKGPNAEPKYPYGSMNKGANFWMDWEREAHIEVFNPDGTTLISQECGTKLHGQYSRAEKQKAFKVIARSQYGSNRFNAKLFTHRPYTEYQSFLLRSSSQDGNKTRMRDMMLQRLAEGTSLDYQESEIGVLYLDGKYWGHYNLRERINTANICQFEGWEGEEDDLDLIKANSNVMQGSNATMEKLLKWVKSNDMNTDEAYRVLDSAIDIQNYIEYMTMEMYTGNTDTLNVKRYRNPKRDGKWRWVLFDLDWGFHEDTNSVRRWLEPGGMGNMKRTDNTLFIACMKNDTFRDRFLTYLGQQMATTLSSGNILKVIEGFYNTMKPILPDQFERWGQTEADYRAAMQKLTSYTKERPRRMLQFLKGAENLHLTKSEMEQYFGDVMAMEGVTYDSIKAA